LIYVYNKVIDEVGSVTDAPAEALGAIAAEARVYRANAYFLLAQMWGKPYQMAAPGDLCVPLLLHNEIDKPAGPQATVHELYKAILDDLDAALSNPDLPAYPWADSRMLGCKLVAQGYKAKVLFFMGRYDEALVELDKTLALMKANQSEKITYGVGDINKGEIYAIEPLWMDGEAILSNVNITADPPTSVMAGMPNGNYLFLTDRVVNMHESMEIMPDYSMPIDMRALLYTNKIGFGATERYPDPENTGYKMRTIRYANMGLTVPELYLMLAECNVRADAGSLATAYTCLDEVRSKRIITAYYMPTGLLSTPNADQTLELILKERICEFASTGMRWLDMRRLWDDPVGGAMIVKTRILGDRTATLTRERLTLRIPQYVMQYNPSWTQNQ
jgi:tetratricopeptide (TPR) repeat protein